MIYFVLFIYFETKSEKGMWEDEREMPLKSKRISSVRHQSTGCLKKKTTFTKER